MRLLCLPVVQAEPAARVRWRSPTLHVILASTLMGVMGVSLISPVLPAVRAGLGVTEAQASLLLSAYTLPGIVMGPVIGMLADRHGRKPVLVPSLLVYGVTGAGVALTGSLWTAVGMRFLQGTAAAGLITLAITLIGDLFEGPDRNRIMGVNGAVLAVGTAAYPLIGGGLSLVDWRAPFLVYAIGVPVGLFALRVLEEPEREPGPRGWRYLTGAVRALDPGPAIALYGSALFIFVILYGGVLTALPFLLDNELGISTFGIGAVLAISSAATALTSSQNGRLAMVLSNRTIIAAGIASNGLSLLGLWLAPSATTAALALLLFGAGMGLAMPSLDTAVSGLVPSAFRGGAMSLRTSMVRLGQTIGPVLFTGLAGLWGYRALLQLSGTLAAGGAVAFLLGVTLARRGAP